MEKEKIKELRNKISVPLSVAIKLLEESNGDVELSVQEFHRNNINTICRLAECNESTAEKYYYISNYDIEKTIKKIHEQLFYLTTTPNEPIGKIGFILWAENESLREYATSSDRSLFIQTKDFDYVMDSFESVFPINNYYMPGSLEQEFDITGTNTFDNSTMRKIVKQIAGIKTDEPNVELFLRELVKWLNAKLRYADVIVVFGNL